MRIIAMLDRSAGNETVGEMWTETHSFPSTAPLSAVIEWAASQSRTDATKQVPNLRLQIDQSDEPQP